MVCAEATLALDNDSDVYRTVKKLLLSKSSLDIIIKRTQQCCTMMYLLTEAVELLCY